MMAKKKIIVALLSFIVLTSVTLLLFRTQAQNSTPALIVHPSNFDLDINPGNPTTQTVTLDNTTNNDLTIRVDLRNFTAQGEEGGVNLTDQDTSFSLASWMSVGPKTTVIPAHGSQTFTVVITPPKNAEPGGHFGSVVFATVPPKTNSGTAAIVSEEVASLILAKVPGPVVEQANMLSFKPNKPFYEFGPVHLIARIQNTGGVHIVPKGQIIVSDMFGRKTYIPFQGSNVLPQSIRQMDTTFNKHFLLGQYTARVIASYGSTNQQLVAATQFTAFPVRYGLIVLAVIILLVLLRRRLGKAFKAMATGK